MLTDIITNKMSSNQINDVEKVKIQKLTENIEKLSIGILPTNEEVSSTIDDLKENKDYISTKNQMSSSGQKVLSKVEDLLDTAKDIMNTKNNGDHIQQAVLHAKNATEQVHIDEKLLGDVVPKNDMEHASENIVDTCNKLVDLGKTFVSSSDFRDVIQDFISMATEIVDYNMPSNIDDIESETEKKVSEMEYNIENVKSGETDPRTAIHKTVDIAADIVDIIIPESIQDHLESQVKKVESGKTSLTDAFKETSKQFYNKIQIVSIPEIKKTEYLERFKEDIKVLQSNPEYQRAVLDLSELFDNLIQGSQKAVDHIQIKFSDAVETTSADTEARQAILHIKAVLENFANGNSFDPIIFDLQTFANNISYDNELKTYIDIFKKFMKETIRDPEFVNDVEFTRSAKYLIDYGKTIVTDRYQKKMEIILKDFNTFFGGFNSDPMNLKLKDKITALGQELFLDESGKPSFKSELVKDMAMLIPLIADQLAYLPIPKIETEDNNMHVVLDNIIIKTSNILPKYIKVGASGIIDSSEITDPKLSSTVRFTISQIQASGNNISYFLKKKTGLIKVSDSGLADFSIHGDGVTLDLEVSIDNINQTFKVNICNIDIDKLSLKIHNSNHDLMYKILRPLIEKIVKNEITNLVKTKLIDVILKLN